MSEITITIPQDKIIKTVERKEVSSNGQISVGAELRGKIITCYVVEEV